MGLVFISDVSQALRSLLCEKRALKKYLRNQVCPLKNSKSYYCVLAWRLCECFLWTRANPCLQCAGKFWMISGCTFQWGQSLPTESVFKEHSCPLYAGHCAKCFANIISELTKISKSTVTFHNIWLFYIVAKERRPWPEGAQLVSWVETRQYAS